MHTDLARGKWKPFMRGYPYRVPDFPPPTREMLAHAIQHSGRSAPGRGGVTGRAYRECFETSLEVLGDCMESFIDPGASSPPQAFFNAMLVCPQKVEPYEIDEGVSGVSVDETRPLSLHEQSFRYLFVAFAHAFGKVVKSTVIDTQDGFLISTVASIVEADAALHWAFRRRKRQGGLEPIP